MTEKNVLEAEKVAAKGVLGTEKVMANVTGKVVGTEKSGETKKVSGAEKSGENEKKANKGRFNLVWLGVAAILIAITTTSVALVVYHNTGDIYIDRSRPGYLPDEEEVSEESEEEEYEFEKTGEMTMEVLEEYLEKLSEEVKMLDAYAEPFSEEALKDESLGIPAE